MRFKLTLLLLVLNAALIVAIIQVERARSVAIGLGRDQSLVLPPGSVERLQAITLLDGSGRVVWGLKMEGERWVLTTPDRWPAQPFAVERLLNQLRFLRWETRFSVSDLGSTGQSLADYGLESPRVTLLLQGEGMSLRLPMGNEAAVGNRVYTLSVEGDAICVIPAEVLLILNLPTPQWRSPRILSIPFFEARWLTVQQGGAAGSRVRIARSGSDWTFESPIQTRADAARIESAITALENLQVVEFIGPGSDEYGLGASALRLTISGNQRRETLIVGNPVPNAPSLLLYGRLEDNPTVFTMSGTPLRPFLEAQVTLRDRRLLRFDPSTVTGLEIAQPPHAVTLQRLETGAWQVLQSDEAGNLQSWPADPAEMDRLLSRLSTLETVRFGTDAPSASDLRLYGLADPQRVVQVRGASPQQLSVGGIDPESGMLWARTSEAATVYQVPAGILHGLPVSALAYRHRVLEELPRGARVIDLRLIDLGTGEAVFATALDPQRETWGTRLADLPEAEREAILQWVEWTKQLRVGRFLRSRYEDPLMVDGRPVSWSHRLEGRWILPGGPSPETRTSEVEISVRMGGTLQYGGSREHGACFTLPQELVDALAILTGGADLPELPPTE